MPSLINKKQETQINFLLHKFRLASISAVLLLVLFTFVVIGVLAQNTNLPGEDYQLPYPGILPNHPLYTIKMFRDRALEVFTREPTRKAQLYLLFADKRIFAAQILSETDWVLSERTASKAEKYFLKAKSSIIGAKKMGVAPEIGFVDKTIAAVNKHQIILNNLIKQAPKEQKTGFKNSLKINGEFLKWIKTFDQK